MSTVTVKKSELKEEIRRQILSLFESAEVEFLNEAPDVQNFMSILENLSNAKKGLAKAYKKEVDETRKANMKSLIVKIASAHDAAAALY